VRKDIKKNKKERKKEKEMDVYEKEQKES